MGKKTSLRDPDTGKFTGGASSGGEKSASANNASALADGKVGNRGSSRKKRSRRRSRKRGLGDAIKKTGGALADRFGNNVAESFGEVFNLDAAKDLGKVALGVGGQFFVPTAVHIVTGRKYDHNGAVAQVTSLIANGLIGALASKTLGVPYIAGALAGFLTQAAFVLADKQIVEKIAGVRLPRWDPKSDTTVGDGIYDNQPYPRAARIEGERAVVYDDADIQKQLENGERLKQLSEAGESVNRFAEGIGDEIGSVLRDEFGTSWLADGSGGYLMLDKSGDPVQDGAGNFYYRDRAGHLKVVDAEGNEVDRVSASVPAHRGEGHSSPQAEHAAPARHSAQGVGDGRMSGRGGARRGSSARGYGHR